MRRRAKVIPFPGRGAPRSGPPEPADESGLVEVHRCHGAEALVVRSLFESEGIPVLLRSRIFHSVHPFTVGDQGTVLVMVPEVEALRARLLLARIAPGSSFP